MRGARAVRSFSSAKKSELNSTVLANGVKIATLKTSDAAANIGVFFKSGSRHENVNNNGISNLVERLVYKKSYIESEVESLGASLNSEVKEEYTGYYLKTSKGGVAGGFSILGNMLSKPTFDAAQVEIEKQAVVAELKAGGTSDAVATVAFYLQASAFQGNSLGNSVIGTSASVKSITKDNLAAHVASNHVGARTVIAATGNVDHDAVVQSAERSFGSLAVGNIVDPAGFVPFTGSDVRYRDDFQPLVHMSIAVQACAAHHDDYPALLVASAIIGDFDVSKPDRFHSSSKLKALTLHDNMATQFHSFYSTFSNTGLWGLSAWSGAMHVEDFVHELQQNWMYLCLSATPNDVARAKNAVLSSLADKTGMCALKQLGTSYLFAGSPISPAQISAAVADIDVQDVRTAANKYLYDKCPVISSHGPIEAVPDYNRVRGGMHWLRV